MILRTCVGTLLFAMACSGTALGQEDLRLFGDVPQWLESYGYEDALNDDGYATGHPEDGPPASNTSTGATSSTPGGTCDCFKCRDKLTGDWFGGRSNLQKEGIVYRGRTTQSMFGVGGGVNEPVPPPLTALGISGGDTFEYTGNSRHDFLIDMKKTVGLPGRFVVTAENLWGRWGNVSFETGGLSPAVLSAIFPIDPEGSGIPYITNFLMIQPLSEHLVMSVGKTRMPSLADNNIFAGGDGSDQFLNHTFAANPLLLPQVPFSSFCISTVMTQDWGNVAFLVLDPQEKTTEFFEVDQLFRTGVGLLGQVQVDTKFFGKPGEHHAGFWYKNVRQIDLAFTPLPPSYPYSPAPPGFASKPDTYSLFYGFDQYVSMYGSPNSPGNSGGGLGGFLAGPASPTGERVIPASGHGTSAPGLAATARFEVGEVKGIGSVSATATPPPPRNTGRFLLSF